MSEVVASLLFFLAFYAHYRKRNKFDKKLFHYLTISIGFMIATEAFFIFDIQTYDITRILVPYLKAISFYILYKALVEYNLEKPYSLLFKELKESEEKYRLIVDNTSDLVFLIDLEGNFLFMNKGIEKHTGFRESEIVGKNIRDFLSPKSYHEAMNRIQLRLKGLVELPKYEVEIISKNKEIIIFELNTSPIYNNGKLESILIVARDVSERKRNEEKINNLNETIKILNKILRHDILNDLTLLLNIVDSCKDGDEVMKKRVFSTINKSVSLIERMRELEQAVTSGDGLRQCKVIDFVDLVTRHHPEVEFTIKGDCTIMADDALISVIENLVSNAIMHGKTKKINAILKDQEKYCEIRIADYGIGIPNHIKDKIFEEGFSYGESKSSGLGLFIVKKVIERYGGEIRVEDNKPKGSVFIIKLKKN
ncbi:MAG: sensory histidine kinase AtoS [Candidatus Methanofastidiosum methylothiophilum]|uniref:histidine kinase n=1 Tax=Candidatus Methanofastidiosum methylothiophilum TaxID=1705564 RepID=A0A150IVH2_9EURY|nr:MAG: sensory histidine kinase AtoS [Candidatus Methanofastidiosum methylthiophilus]